MCIRDSYYAGTQWLANYPYRIEISAWLFVLTVIITAGIAFFTVSYDALRAALMNPVKSLRTE